MNKQNNWRNRNKSQKQEKQTIEKIEKIEKEPLPDNNKDKELEKLKSELAAVKLALENKTLELENIELEKLKLTLENKVKQEQETKEEQEYYEFPELTFYKDYFVPNDTEKVEHYKIHKTFEFNNIDIRDFEKPHSYGNSFNAKNCKTGTMADFPKVYENSLYNSTNDIIEWTEYYNNRNETLLIVSFENGIIEKTYFRNYLVNRFHEIGPAKFMYVNGFINCYCYMKDNILHRPTKYGPAEVILFDTGKIWIKKYYVNGNMSRNSAEGPAELHYHYNNNIKYAAYYNKSILTNDNEPAVYTYDEHNNLEYMAYYYNDYLHKTYLDGPALIIFKNNDNKELHYYNKGQLHRQGRPAIIKYANDKLSEIMYYSYGQIDNAIGPAHICYERDNSRDNSNNESNGDNISERPCLVRYYRNNHLHRNNSYLGPTSIFRTSKTEMTKEYYFNTYYHNQNGPAIERYKKDKLVNSEYYLYGNKCLIENSKNE